MASLNEDELKEEFKLFDQDGTGIKLKDLGTVLRSLGLSVPQAQLRNMTEQAVKKDSNFVQFPDFLVYVKQAAAFEEQSSGDFPKEMVGMKTGIHHFFDKMSPKQITAGGNDFVKIADLKHLLSAVGEKMSEEECEDMSREIRNKCSVEDNKVKFDDFVALLSGNLG
eukprot:TRINITY_DN69949_c0_g1_i1.p1 TRINITY_DN69949_c0_g1~~TRINITY_DN69949_c0_g1_i1.p1  ORF type:complete len:167 (+),score=49.84 TRINITY_DN69949_c0_g1_i1:87-587(+)